MKQDNFDSFRYSIEMKLSNKKKIVLNDFLNTCSNIDIKRLNNGTLIKDCNGMLGTIIFWPQSGRISHRHKKQI